MFLVGYDGPAENVAMSGEILGQAVDGHVRAEFQRPHQHRRGEGVVDDQRRSDRARHFGNLVDLPDAKQGIGDGLHHDAAGLVLVDGGLHCIQVADIDEVDRRHRTAP